MSLSRWLRGWSEPIGDKHLFYVSPVGWRRPWAAICGWWLSRKYRDVMRKHGRLK